MLAWRVRTIQTRTSHPCRGSRSILISGAWRSRSPCTESRFGPNAARGRSWARIDRELLTLRAWVPIGGLSGSLERAGRPPSTRRVIARPTRGGEAARQERCLRSRAGTPSGDVRVAHRQRDSSSRRGRSVRRWGYAERDAVSRDRAPRGSQPRSDACFRWRCHPARAGIANHRVASHGRRGTP